MNDPLAGSRKIDFCPGVMGCIEIPIADADDDWNKTENAKGRESSSERDDEAAEAACGAIGAAYVNWGT